MIVRLNQEMIKNKLGFHDLEHGQKIFQSSDAYDAGVSEDIEVKDTPFVQEKLGSGELVLPEEGKKKPAGGETGYENGETGADKSLMDKVKEKFTGSEADNQVENNQPTE